MRKLLTYAGVVALVLTFATSAFARPNAHKMTLRQLEAAQQQVITQDLHTIHWWNTHRGLWHPKRQLTSDVRMHGGEPYDLWWHKQQLKWVTRELGETQAKIRAQANQAPTGYPPHHKLWQCIARFESNGPHDRRNPSYRGYLQMSYNWLGYIKGDPADYSQAAQEWAAERAWAANGYSLTFLQGQWYNYDNADGCGTTG